MSKDLDKLILKKIENVLDDHSGGMKYTELISIMIEWVYEEMVGTQDMDKKYVRSNLVRIIQESKNVKILNYTDRRNNREKMFIFFP